MKNIDMSAQDEKLNFAKRAACHFKNNPKHYTYTDKEIKSGELFAIRYGLDEDGVLVFRISEEEVENYMEIIANLK